jgi:hypothetical protein
MPKNAFFKAFSGFLLNNSILVKFFSFFGSSKNKINKNKKKLTYFTNYLVDFLGHLIENVKFLVFVEQKNIKTWPS